MPPADLVPALVADPVTRAGMIRHLPAGSFLGDRGFGSPYPCFRASAARSTTLPHDVQRRLLDDERNVVRTAMFRTFGDRMDPATAERIDRAFGPNRKVRVAPGRRLHVPGRIPATLRDRRRFATDDDPRRRCLAPCDPDLPSESCALPTMMPPSVGRSRPTRICPARPADRRLGGCLGRGRRLTASPHLPVAGMVRLVSKLT
ncbi:hypothetical protein AB0M54_00375 [Actinoplanes sp. NPDC051470]|uniref:hypothetical protein n=1 Tax=Actinoplanes sp. NPDC051470 TaxID=3157224 RepID=UPI003439FF79